MDWAPLVSTAVGAFIALSGTLLADVRRDKQQRNRDRHLDRRQSYLDFTLALDSAHGRLRETARSDDPAADLDTMTAEAVGGAGLYAAREEFLMMASPSVTRAGEAAFARLINMRSVLRSRVGLKSTEYHGAYHDFAEALWEMRMAIREDLGSKPLTPQDLDRKSWSEREDCVFCKTGT